MELSERVLRRFRAKTTNKLMEQTEPLLDKARSAMLRLKDQIADLKEDSDEARKDILATMADVNSAAHGVFVRIRKFELDFKSHDAVHGDFEYLGERLHLAEAALQRVAHFILDHKKHMTESEEDFGVEGDHVRSFASHAWKLADIAYRDARACNTAAAGLHLKSAP